MSAPTANATPAPGIPIGRPRPSGAHRSLVSRLRGRIALVRRYRVPFFCEFVRDADTNATVFLTKHATPLVGKYYVDSAEAKSELAAERSSWVAFCDRPWRMPVVAFNSRSVLMRRLPDEARIDMRARTMTAEQRLEVAVWAVDVLLQIYLAGYLHGDLQPHNVWWLDGRLVVTDWATFATRSPGIAFIDSADVSGGDPRYERRFDPAFDPDDPWSFHNALGVSLGQAVDALRLVLNAAPQDDETSAKLTALEGFDAGRIDRDVTEQKFLHGEGEYQ